MEKIRSEYKIGKFSDFDNVVFDLQLVEIEGPQGSSNNVVIQTMPRVDGAFLQRTILFMPSPEGLRRLGNAFLDLANDVTNLESEQLNSQS